MLHSPYRILRIREPPVLVSQGLLYSTLKFAKKKNSVEICCKNYDCVVPENIYTPSPPPPHPFTEGNGTSEGRGSKRRQFPRGWGVASPVFFPGVPSKIDEQAITYFTVFRCFKAKNYRFFSMIFYLQSADYFFSRACTMVNVTRLSYNI